MNILEIIFKGRYFFVIVFINDESWNGINLVFNINFVSYYMLGYVLCVLIYMLYRIDYVFRIRFGIEMRFIISLKRLLKIIWFYLGKFIFLGWLFMDLYEFFFYFY